MRFLITIWPEVINSTEHEIDPLPKGATKTNLINPLGAWLDKPNNF